jgi:outer membrane usher protein FimD/PapC
MESLMQLIENNYQYSEFEYEELQDALDKADRYSPGVSNYQYQQNQLNKEIARFLLKPYTNKGK